MPAFSEETTMKISARNILSGTVKHVEHGAVNSEITIELPGGVLLTSIITKSSAERLHLVAGKKAYAVVKASDVLVGVDD
jgi:molybdopterin-binding protein